MSGVVWGMIAAGAVTLLLGLFLAWPRFSHASGAGRVLVLAPLFEAVALAMFAFEHFLMARALMDIVPNWLPGHLFWTYLVGAALLAAAISLITWMHVNLSAPLLALLFFTIVVTIDLPGLSQHLHERLFWTLTVRETAFAGGALVLAGSVLPRKHFAGAIMLLVGRVIVACTCIAYAIEHFFFPRFVPGVPLEKMTPPSVPAPQMLGYVVGLVLLVCGIGLLIPRFVRLSAAVAGAMLLLLTLLFYVPILVMEIHTPLVLEGTNYVGDTLLFAATVLLAGRESENA